MIAYIMDQIVSVMVLNGLGLVWGGPQALWNKEKPRRLGGGQGARKSRCESDSELPACLLGKIPCDKTGLRFSTVGGNAEQELSHAQVDPRTGRPPGRLRLIGAWMV